MAGLRFNIHAFDKTKKAFDSVKNNVRGLKSQFSSLKGQIRGIGPLMVAAFSGAAIRAIVATTDKIDKFSLRLGISREKLSELKFAGEQTGVEFNQLTLGLQRMTRRIAEAAQGTGEAKTALAELGLSAQELSTLSPDEQFMKIADAMQGVESQSDKVRLAFKLFDSEGVSLIQTMIGGSQQINRFGQELRDLGAIVDSDATKNITELNDSWNRMTTALEGAGRNLLAFFAPALDFVMDLVTEAIALISKLFRIAREAQVGLASTGIAIGEFFGLIDEDVAAEAFKLANEKIEEIRGNTKRATKEVKDFKNEINTLENNTKINRGSVVNGNGDKGPTRVDVKGTLSETDKEALRTMDRIEDRFRDGLSSIVTDWENAGDAIKSTIKDIGNAILSNQMNQIFDSIAGSNGSGDLIQGAQSILGDLLGYGGNADGSGGGGSLFGSIGDFFGGFFADGGAFNAGKPIVVGEKGPELIYPRQSGTVVPNHAMASAGGTTINMNISTPDANSFRASQAQITAEMAQAISIAQRRNL